MVTGEEGLSGSKTVKKSRKVKEKHVVNEKEKRATRLVNKNQRIVKQNLQEQLFKELGGIYLRTSSFTRFILQLVKVYFENFQGISEKDYDQDECLDGSNDECPDFGKGETDLTSTETPSKTSDHPTLCKNYLF